MKLQLIRNATIKMVYAGKTILIDPMLCEKETMEPFMKGLQKNPTVDLTIPVEEIIEDIDAVLVTHSHPDHFDTISSELVPKNIQLFATPTDKDFFAKQSFNNVTIIEKTTTWSGIKITRIEGQHGSGPILPFMGNVSGYILQAKDEPTIYLVSDSILVDAVISTIDNFKPQVIITNSGGGIFPGYEDYPVLMNEEQTIRVATLLPSSKIVAVHLESIDFSKTTRKSLRDYANEKGISKNQLLIPKDGEQLNF
ncbi:MAG: MBL fold metallo-hydrolase [Cellulophaga sp.]